MIRGGISRESRNTLVVIPITLRANLYIKLMIGPVVLVLSITITVDILQHNNVRPHADIVTPNALQSVDMLP